jgi:hypothetical protein
LCPVTAQIQSLAQKFPTQENWEFSNRLQGRFLDEQGSIRSSRLDRPLRLIARATMCADAPSKHLSGDAHPVARSW